MTFFLQEIPQGIQLPARQPPREPSSFGEGFWSAVRSENLRRNANFREQREIRKSKAEIAERAREVVGPERLRERLAEKNMLNPRLSHGSSEVQAVIMELAREMAEEDPDLFDFDLSDDAITEQAHERLREEYQETLETLDMMPEYRGLAEFSGGFSSFLFDIRNLPFLVAGGGKGTFLRVMGREASINVAAEMAFIRDQFRMSDVLQIEDPNALQQLALAGAFGAAFGGAVEGGRRGLAYYMGRSAPSQVPDGMSPDEWQRVIDAAERGLEDGEVSDAARRVAEALESIPRRDTPQSEHPMGPLILDQSDRIDVDSVPPMRSEDGSLPDDVMSATAERAIQRAEADTRPATPDEISAAEQAVTEAQEGINRGGDRPVISYMRRQHTQTQPGTHGLTTESLQIHPDGAFAQELRAAGVYPGARGVPPGLFSRSGRMDFDNLVASEWEEMFPGIIDATGSRGAPDGYLSRQGFLDYVVGEATGQPSPLHAQQRLSRAEAELAQLIDRGVPTRAQVQREYLSNAVSDDPNSLFINLDEFHFEPSGFDADEAVERTVRDWLESRGYRALLTPEEQAELISTMQQRGGDAEILVENMLSRELEYTALPAAQAQRIEDVPWPDAPARSDPAQGRDVASVREGEGRPGQDATPARDGRPDDAADRGAAAEATDAGEQLLIDGVSPITQRDRMAARQDARLEGGERGPDSEIGGLFDPHAKARSDLFDDVTSPQAERMHDQMAADIREQIAAEGDFMVDMGDGRGTRAASSVLDEFDADRNFLEILDICGRPRA